MEGFILEVLGKTSWRKKNEIYWQRHDADKAGREMVRGGEIREFRLYRVYVRDTPEGHPTEAPATVPA